MSFVTTACGGAPRRGSAAPPDPCPHSGAATSAATATVADHRVQCIIPTSVKGRRLLTEVDRKSTRLNSSHGYISYAVFCLKKKKTHKHKTITGALSRDRSLQLA